MKFSKILFLLLFWLVSISVYGQKQSKDIVILEDRSRLIGEVISYNPVTELIFSMGGHELVIPAEKVNKVIMDDKTVHLSALNSKSWYYRANFGVLTNQNGTGVSFNHSFYYGLKSWLQVGAGFGIDNYYLQSGRNIWPLYAEVKSYLVESNSSPYLSLKSGYSFIFTSEENAQTYTCGGPMIAPSIGYRIGSRGMFIDLYAGVRFQSAEYHSIIFNGGNSEQRIVWKRLELGLGFNF